MKVTKNYPAWGVQRATDARWLVNCAASTEAWRDRLSLHDITTSRRNAQLECEKAVKVGHDCSVQRVLLVPVSSGSRP
jgi:hypothetical protein